MFFSPKVSIVSQKFLRFFRQKSQNIMTSIVICLKMLIANMTLKTSKNILSLAILRFSEIK